MGDRKAVDLFAGAGGASLGLIGAGFDVVGFDFGQPAVDTHNANGMPAHLHDLSDPALDHLIPDCDLMWCSPPCQPFSAAGDGEGEFDDRDGFPWALRIIGLRLPPVVIVENVKGLTFEKHRGYLSGILEQLRTFGYHVEVRVLNTADFGVPQTRERCIIVARRDGGRITWPMPTHTEHAGMFTQRWVTMADALGWGMDRPSFTVLSGGTDTGGAEPFSAASRRVMLRTGANSMKHGREASDIEPYERDIDRPAPAVDTKALGAWQLNTGRDWKKGGTREDAQTIQPAPAIAAPSGQWAWTRPATTISCDTRVAPAGHHDSQMNGAIRLTIAELATLQGFPPGFVWTGNKSAQAKCVGNAVPPALAEVVARANLPLT